MEEDAYSKQFKSFTLFYSFIGVILALLFGITVFQTQKNLEPIETQDEAISLILKKHPEFNDSRPKLYFSQLVGNDWYIGVGILDVERFISEGQCFRVKEDASVQKTSLLHIDDTKIQNINPVECTGV